MDCLVSVFLSSIFGQGNVNIENFRVGCNAVNFKILTKSDSFKLVIILMYIETQLLLNLIKSYQNLKGNVDRADDLSKILDKAKKLLSQIDSQVGFLNEAPEVHTNSIKLSINCMRKGRSMDGWPKHHAKIDSAVHQLVSVYILPDERHPVRGTSNGSVPFGVLFTQLQDFALNKNTETHPSIWLSDDVIRSRLTDMLIEFRKRKDQESVMGDGGNLFLSWISSLASFDCSKNGLCPGSSVAVQTDEALEMAACPQSTPDTTTIPNVKYLLPMRKKDFITDLDTPPDSPPGKYSARRSTELALNQPKPNVMRPLRNLSLTLTDDQETVARRRKPWTLPETLALWHEVQQALPNPPSWAQIRDKVFISSRRTNVDLKDRWRVIQRDTALQSEIRLYYEKWLAGKNKSSK